MSLSKKNLFFLILIVAAICFSPRFSVGHIGRRSIDIRIEDILCVVLGIEWLLSFLVSNSTKVRKPPLFLPIFCWVSIGFISTSINLILGNVTLPRSFFYFLKEIEYFFLYFYVFYHIKSAYSIISVIKSWFIFGAINVVWIILQLMGIVKGGEYGYRYSGAYLVGAIGEKGPFPSGGFFLMLVSNLLSFLFFYKSFSKKWKVFGGLVVFGLFLGIFGTMRRSVMVGLIVALFVIVVIYILRAKRRKVLLNSLAFLSLVIFISFLFFKTAPLRPGVFNSQRIIWELNERIGIWVNQIKTAFQDSFYIFLGQGKSVLLTTEESHSGYVRNLVETGVVGFFAFLFLMYIILKKSIQNFFYREDPLVVSLSASLFVSTIALLVIAIPAEGFTVVRINEVYWFFAGLTMAVMSLKTKEDYGE
ncbi:MAG: hypothetical protein DRP84_08560 [Spirochaetes bacterium]|nr:MAG: hypothetical protein DRP84_08560 [Spirochaetota bacterium]